MIAVPPGASDFRFPWDEELLRWANAKGAAWVDQLFVTASSPTFGIGALVVLILWWVVRYRGLGVAWALRSVVAVALTDVFGARVLKPFFARVRPSYMLADSLRVLAPAADLGSLPSLHAANSFAVATVVVLMAPQTAVYALPVAVLISWSRIAVGVHWPSDVYVGALYGVGVGFLVVWLANKLPGGKPTDSLEGRARPGWKSAP